MGMECFNASTSYFRRIHEADVVMQEDKTKAGNHVGLNWHFFLISFSSWNARVGIYKSASWSRGNKLPFLSLVALVLSLGMHIQL